MLTNDVLKDVFGPDATEANIIASFILVFLGAAINFMIEIGQRDPTSSRTPTKFSLLFLIQDNLARIIISFLFCCIAVISGPSLIDYVTFNFHIPDTLSRFSTILLGWGSDYLPMKIKQRFFKNDNTITNEPG